MVAEKVALKKKENDVNWIIKGAYDFTFKYTHKAGRNLMQKINRVQS